MFTHVAQEDLWAKDHYKDTRALLSWEWYTALQTGEALGDYGIQYHGQTQNLLVFEFWRKRKTQDPKSFKFCKSKSCVIWAGEGLWQA